MKGKLLPCKMWSWCILKHKMDRSRGMLDCKLVKVECQPLGHLRFSFLVSCCCCCFWRQLSFRLAVHQIPWNSFMHCHIVRHLCMSQILRQDFIFSWVTPTSFSPRAPCRSPAQNRFWGTVPSPLKVSVLKTQEVLSIKSKVSFSLEIDEKKKKDTWTEMKIGYLCVLYGLLQTEPVTCVKPSPFCFKQWFKKTINTPF